jgi:hypothetical protein
VIRGAQLIHQNDEILEKGEIRKDGEVSLTEVEKDDDLENVIGIQMDEFNLEVVKESTKKIASWKLKSPLKYHNKKIKFKENLKSSINH